MARLPANFVQSIDPEDLKRLPEFCTYEGEAADLLHLRGLLIPTVEVERLVYVGERENVWVEYPDGFRKQPWKGVWVYEVGVDGKPVTDGYSNAPPIKEGPANGMSMLDLNRLGMSDAELDELAQEYLGERWDPDTSGKSLARRAVFDRVMAATHR